MRHYWLESILFGKATLRDRSKNRVFANRLQAKKRDVRLERRLLRRVLAARSASSSAAALSGPMFGLGSPLRLLGADRVFVMEGRGWFCIRPGPGAMNHVHVHWKRERNFDVANWTLHDNAIIGVRSWEVEK